MLKYKKGPLLISILVLILWIGVYYFSGKILALSEMSFRNWVSNIFWIITILLSAFIIVTGIVKLVKCGADAKHWGLKIAAWVGVLALITGLIFGGYMCILSTAFIQPEHVVDKDGKKMVASVQMFVNVDVDYYDYLNGFIRGQHRMREDYGNGSFDPFKREVMPKPSHTYYYD